MSGIPGQTFQVEQNGIRFRIFDQTAADHITKDGTHDVHEIPGTPFFLVRWRLTRDEMARFVLGDEITGKVDFGLPQDWIEQNRADVGDFVWSYLDGGALGKPYNLTLHFYRTLRALVARTVADEVAHDICNPAHALWMGMDAGSKIVSMAHSALNGQHERAYLFFGDLTFMLYTLPTPPATSTSAPPWTWVRFKVRVNSGAYAEMNTVETLAHVRAMMQSEIKSRCFARECQAAQMSAGFPQ